MITLLLSLGQGPRWRPMLARDLVTEVKLRLPRLVLKVKVNFEIYIVDWKATTCI